MLESALTVFVRFSTMVNSAASALLYRCENASKNHVELANHGLQEMGKTFEAFSMPGIGPETYILVD